MKTRCLEIPLVVTALAAVSLAALWYVHRMDWTLYNPDAEAHLNIARRIVDSRTPGYDQIGTAWLPLLHLLTIPLVVRDSLWQSGVAGAIPSAVCFVMAGAFLFAAVRRALRSSVAACAALGVFALNPNLLYLQSTPMTEAVFFGALMALLYFTVLFHDTRSLFAASAAGVAALAASLTRYEGWFLLPFVAVYLWIAGGRRIVPAILFCAIAGLGPAWWFAHNYWVYGDALAFYNGPWSAIAIYQRALDQGVARYRGDHDWLQALLYYATAAWLCVGTLAVLLGAVGLAGIARARAFWPAIFLSLPPIFYVWSMHSSGTPIYVPNLWPNSYYNTRYGLAVLPLLSFCAAALVLLAPKRLRVAAAMAIPCAALVPWLLRPVPDSWICWKESQVNSVARRAWTREAASFLTANYKTGDGILTAHGVAGVLRAAGIPLRESLNIDNPGIWEITCERPDLFLHEEWVIALAGDAADTAVTKTTTKPGPKYDLVRSIIVKDAPVVEIYRRAHTAIQPPADPDPDSDDTEKLLPYEPKQMTIRFTKAHGAGNDFLLTWAEDLSADAALPAIARAICNRHTGVGSDGWMLVRRDSIRLFNADGSEPELSGNGTRCAAALLVHSGLAESDVTLHTGAGPKHLKLIERAGLRYLFEMEMGLPVFRRDELRFPLPLTAGTREVAIVNVGNPQCAVFVDAFPEDWRSIGAEVEAHRHFPQHTNVSFVRVLDQHAIEVRFFERGVGETLSSGTGSTGAAVAGILRGRVQSPVRIQTPAGDLHLRWTDSVWLTGPAEITATGEFLFDTEQTAPPSV